MSTRLFDRIVGLGASVCIGGFLLRESIFDVPAGHRAVIFDRKEGVLNKSLGEGKHFKIPFFQYPMILDVRPYTHTIHSRTGTKDEQVVNISLQMLYHPVPEKLPHLYVEFGPDAATPILPPLGNEVVRSVVEQYFADEVLASRDEILQRISTEITDRANEFWFSIEDVSITSLQIEEE